MVSASRDPCAPPTLTARLADACLGMTYDSLPAATRRRTKLILLDTLGAMFSASRPLFGGTQRLSEFVRAERDDGPCGVVGTNIHTSPTNAALMNGYLGYALDSESHHGAAILHAAALVVPAVLATAQQESREEGSDFLAAITLGIDVACRVSLAIGPNDLYARGFHPTAVAGAFGAAAASGALLRLNRQQIENSMGLAATMAGGLLAWASDQSEESRPFNPGLAARNGVTAARLAALGFGAPQGIFDADSKYNVFRAWSLDGIGSPDRLLEGFGEKFSIEELIIKRHASCSFLHPAVDGLLSILQDRGLSQEDIASIIMRFPSSGAPIIDNNPLRSHRAQYILPLAAIRGRVQFEDVIFDRSSEESVRRLTEITSIVHDDELDRGYPDRYTTVIEVVTRAGEKHSRRVEWARGCPENPMTDDEIVAKYRYLAGQRVDDGRAQRILALVDGLEQPGELSQLFEALLVS